MKAKIDIKVEKAEFILSDGTNVVWMKEGKRWHVALYKFSHDSQYIWTVGHLPSIKNAIYFANKYKLKYNA